MSPVAKADGHDAPWVFDELVPGVAAVIDDDAFESQLSRMNCILPVTAALRR
jgi:hypothetical protein